MNKTTIFRCAAIAAAAFAVTTQNPSAYSLKTAKWGTTPVPFYVNAQNLDAVAESALIAAVQHGAYAWTNQSNAAFAFYYAGHTSGTSAASNGKNEIVFRNATNSTAIATTYTYSSGGRIVDTDIIFWDAAYKFFTGSSGCSGGFYIEDVAAHEFGHALGLGHSTVSGATMEATMRYCSTGPRTLSEDDKQGVEALYSGAASNTAPSVSISSPVTGTSVNEGVAVSFSGTSTDVEDGDLGSTIVWVSSRDGEIGRGKSFQRVLSTGSHTVTAKVTDSKGATAQMQVGVNVKVTATVAPPDPTFVLTASGFKVKGLQAADLFWSGTSVPSIDVYRNGTKVRTVANTGRHTDSINSKGSGTYTYRVCEAGTSTCSSSTMVKF